MEDLTSEFEFNEYVTAIAWKADSSEFAVAMANGEIVKINLLGDRPIRTTFREKDDFSITALGYSANGEFLAAAGQAGYLWVWQGAELIQEFQLEGWINQLAWQPLGDLLAFGSGKKLYVWNVQRRELEPESISLESALSALNWYYDGDRLSAVSNQVMRSWNSEDLCFELDPFKLNAPGLSIAWAPENEFFAIGCFDRSILLAHCFDAGEIWRLGGMPEKVSHLAWQPINNFRLASASGDGVVIWGWENGGWEGVLVMEGEGRVNALDWSKSGLLIATEQTVRLLEF